MAYTGKIIVNFFTFPSNIGA